MITDVLLEHAGLVPVALLAVALLCIGIGYLVLRAGGSRRIAWILTALCVLPVLALTLVPASRNGDHPVCTVQFALPTLGSVELLANVALFLPPAFFAALATRRPLQVLLAATGASAAIEALQALAPGIGRACDTNDWLMNTLGIGVGVLLAGAVTALVRSRAPRPPR